MIMIDDELFGELEYKKNSGEAKWLLECLTSRKKYY